MCSRKYTPLEGTARTYRACKCLVATFLCEAANLQAKQAGLSAGNNRRGGPPGACACMLCQQRVLPRPEREPDSAVKAKPPPGLSPEKGRIY